MKIFEAFITSIRDREVHFTLVDDKNGFAGYQKAPIKCLLEKKIKCQKGTIFFITDIIPGPEAFVTIDSPELITSGNFLPWEEHAVSKKMADIIVQYYNEELDNIAGFMADRLIEYGKFKNGDQIIERIANASNNLFKELEEHKEI